VKGGGRRNVQNVSRLNDEAPSCPDQSSTGEGEVLGEGEFFNWAVEI